jgi:hypothetical protein
MDNNSFLLDGESNNENIKASTRSLVEEIAENEAFLKLISIIEKTTRRKKDLLAIINDSNQLLGHQVKTDCKPEMSATTREHIDWILDNLERTNQVLNTAMNHLRIIYGEAYLEIQ